MDDLCWNNHMGYLYCLSYLLVPLLLVWWFGRIKWDNSAKIPGPSSVPIIGDITSLRLRSTPFLELLNLKRRYGSIFRIWFGRSAYAIIMDVGLIEKIYSKYSVRNRAENITNPVKKILLDGLLVSKNENWRKSRKIVVSTLHKKSINMSIENFVKNSNILVNRLLGQANDTAVDIFRYFTQFGVDVTLETMLGVEGNTQISNDWHLFKNIRRCFTIAGERYIKPWLYIDWVFKMTTLGKEYQCIFENIRLKLGDIVRKRQEVMQSDIKVDENGSSSEYTKCIDLLLAKGTKSEKVLGDCSNLFAAGASTVGVTCSYVFVFLAENPEVQDKLIQEQLEIFGNEDFKRPVRADDLPQMTYLEQVIKETLRLCPPIPLTFRQHDQDLDIGNGMTIPANTCVIICNYLVQRDAEHFPNPLKFNPDNFAADLERKRHPYSYTPFGGGSRMCICQNLAMVEIKVALSTVLRHVRATEAVNSSSELEKNVVLSIDLRSALEILVKLSPRN